MAVALSACTSAKSVTIASSSTYSRAVPETSNVRTSFTGDATAMPPAPSYLRGRPPSATCVPTPVCV